MEASTNMISVFLRTLSGGTENSSDISESLYVGLLGEVVVAAVGLLEIKETSVKVLEVSYASETDLIARRDSK